MSNRATSNHTPSLVEVLKSMGHEFRSLYDQFQPINGGSKTDSQRRAAYDAHYRHPIWFLFRLIEESTGIDRHVVEQAALRLNTPLGLAPMKVTQPRTDPALADSGFLEDDPKPDIPDLRELFPKLTQCDLNGTTATILRRFEDEYPGVLTRFFPERVLRPIEHADKGNSKMSSLPDLARRVHDLARDVKVREQFECHTKEYIAWREKNRGGAKELTSVAKEVGAVAYFPFDRFDESERPRDEPIPSMTLTEKFAVLAAIHDNHYEYDGRIGPSLDCENCASDGSTEAVVWMVVLSHVRNHLDKQVERVEDWYKDVMDDLRHQNVALKAATDPALADGPTTTGFFFAAGKTAGDAGTKTKRSTQNGQAQEKLISALTKWHNYAHGSGLNPEPIGSNELAKLAGVSQGSAHNFFESQFGKETPYQKYQVLCRKKVELLAFLKNLNREFTPNLLYGSKPHEKGGKDHNDDKGP